MNYDHDENRHFYASDDTEQHPNAQLCRPNYTAQQTATKQIWTTEPITVSSHFIMLKHQSGSKDTTFFSIS